MEPHLIGNNDAQLAKDCEFDAGSLVPVHEGFELATLQSNPIRGLYTDDGTNYFSWPVEAQVFPSPYNNDSFRRIYYLLPSEGVLRVASRTEMSPLGPTPAGVRAGLPSPVAKPVLSLRDRTTLPDYPIVQITAETWWQNTSNNAVVNLGAATVTPIVALRQYQVSLPSLTGAPANKRLGVRLVFTDAAEGKEIFSLSGYPGSTPKSQAVPGTVEARIEEDSVKGMVYLTWGVQESRAYTYSYENTWNEESSAAPPAVISPTYVQDVQIDVTPGDFTGYRPLLKYRIYRTFGNVATYIETNAVQDGSIPTRFYDSATRPDSAKGILESTDYLPLGTGIQGMEAMPGDWLVAFKDKTLYLSEVGKYHAWPYSQNFRSSIRGVRAGQQALVVTTADGVYEILGALPSAVQQIKLSLPQPGIAQRSMANVDGAVAYASNDGIAMVAGASGTMEVSQRLFTRKKWRADFGDVLDDASLMFAYFDGRLIAQSHTQPLGFSVRLDEDVGSFVRHEERFDAMQNLPVTDILYYTIGNKVYQYRGGTAYKTFDWWGKDFIFPAGAVFGAGFIRCDGPILVRLYADGELVNTDSLVSGYFRLPDLNSALRWSVRLSGASRVNEFVIGRSMKELKNV